MTCHLFFYFFTFFRLDKICNANGSKTRINVKQEVVSVFTFNSSLVSGSPGVQEFKCHLELYLPSSSYGFSVFIEEMSLSGSGLSGCNEDYVQFGRDILFVTTHLRYRSICRQVSCAVFVTSDCINMNDFRKNQGERSYHFTPFFLKIFSFSFM